jgi:hypothetical protein
LVRSVLEIVARKANIVHISRHLHPIRPHLPHADPFLQERPYLPLAHLLAPLSHGGLFLALGLHVSAAEANNIASVCIDLLAFYSFMISLFAVARNRFRRDGYDAEFGPMPWISLVATLLLIGVSVLGGCGR